MLCDLRSIRARFAARHAVRAAQSSQAASGGAWRFVVWPALLWVCGACCTIAVGAGAAEDVTFLVTSDCHYDAFENEDRNQRNRSTIDQMNRIAEASWPESLGGGPIGRPRGVAVLGDVIDDGDRMIEGKNQSEAQYRFFLADFGLDGTVGRLNYPVFEGWGNHDGPPPGLERNGFSFQSQLKRRNALRREKHLIGRVSDNGLHYSWDWADVHFVHLNLYASDAPHPKIRYSPTHHDPQQSLAFLKADLADAVGRSGRPVVLMQHYDFQGTDWWHDDQRRALYEAVKPYNVIAVFHGHTATGVYAWKPEGEDKPLDVINTGQTENGFFVVELRGDRLRLAYRLKEGVVRTKQPPPADGATRVEWNGQWGWRWPLSRAVARPAVD